MSSMFAQELTDEQIETFAAFLAPYEDAHNYPAAHGYLCAHVIVPTELAPEQLIDGILDEEAQFESEEQKSEIIAIIQQLQNNADAVISSGDPLHIPVHPFILEKEVNPELIDWCLGFMDAVFENEDQWYEGNEEIVAELLLPFAALSDVFDDKELRQLVSSPKKAKQMGEQLPQILIDLYLVYRQE